jgi:beta-galactosidase
MRGLKSKNIWITEQIMGAQGHDVTGYSPRPNQAKMWSYQGFAHGCTSMMYFRYRGATKGAEQFCYGVIDADNVKRRKFYEVQSIFNDVIKYKDALEQPVESKVAIVYDYDSLAAFRIQSQSFLLDCQGEMMKYYKAFYDVNISVDVIPADADFTKYSVVILPQMIIEKPEFTARVKSFVKAGGTVILTYRTAVKDINNNLEFGKSIPLDYSDFAGVTVVETESLQEGQEFPLRSTKSIDISDGEGTVFRDMLEVTDAEVLYKYGDTFYDNFPAITRKKQGNGTVYYIGCGLDESTTKEIMDVIISDCNLPTHKSADGVEICYRNGKEQNIRLIMNHNAYKVNDGDIHLAPYESRIEIV